MAMDLTDALLGSVLALGVVDSEDELSDSSEDWP